MLRQRAFIKKRLIAFFLKAALFSEIKLGVRSEGSISMTPGGMKQDGKPFSREHEKGNLGFLFYCILNFSIKAFRKLLMDINLLFPFLSFSLKTAAANVVKWLQEAISQIEENAIKIDVW